MNDQDRKKLEEIKTTLEEAMAEAICLAEDMDARTCNYEDSFEGSERAETMRDQVDRVEGLNGDLENLIAEIEEVVGA